MSELLAWEKHGKLFIGTPQEFVDELTYASYKHQRETSPTILPEQWGRLFPQWMRFEARYQQSGK